MSLHPIHFVNSALVRMRRTPITQAAYDAEDVTGAPVSDLAWACRATFENVIDFLCRSGNWNCITKRATLTQDTVNTPAWGFSSRYLLPADFRRLTTLRLDGHEHESTAIAKKARLEDDENLTVPSLVTDASTVEIRYVYAPTTWVTTEGADYAVPAAAKTFLGKLDHGFREALIQRLEQQLMYTLTGNEAGAQRKREEAEETLQDALSFDAADDGPEKTALGPLNDCRC